jgi:excisionase family DNA binding protein
MDSPTADPALETLTVPEAARLLRISDRHAYRMAERGNLPGAIHLGRCVRISKPLLLAWLKRQGAARPGQ